MAVVKLNLARRKCKSMVGDDTVEIPCVFASKNVDLIVGSVLDPRASQLRVLKTYSQWRMSSGDPSRRPDDRAF